MKRPTENSNPPSIHPTNYTLNRRREFIRGAALLAAGLATVQAANAQADSKSKSDAKKAKSDAASSLTIQSPDAAKNLSGLSDLAANCAVIADRCVQHCTEQMSGPGGASFIDCLTGSSQMSVVCSAMSKLAAMKSVRVIDFIDGCTSACTACKDACDQHKEHWAHGMHIECKNCSEHCEKMISELGKIKAVLLKVS